MRSFKTYYKASSRKAGSCQQRKSPNSGTGQVVWVWDNLWPPESKTTAKKNERAEHSIKKLCWSKIYKKPFQIPSGNDQVTTWKLTRIKQKEPQGTTFLRGGFRHILMCCFWTLSFYSFVSFLFPSSSCQISDEPKEQRNEQNNGIQFSSPAKRQLSFDSLSYLARQKRPIFSPTILIHIINPRDLN